MAVSGLEQRYVPLIELQVVWQPWGPAGRYPLEDGHDGASRAPRTRSHSWAGYTTDAQRERFNADSHQPSQGPSPHPTAAGSSRGGAADEPHHPVGCVGYSHRQVAGPPFDGSRKSPVNHESHAPSPIAPSELQGGSELARGDVAGHAAVPSIYESSGPPSDSEVGLDALKSQCSSDTLGTNLPSEGSWEDSCDSPDSDDQWAQAFQSILGGPASPLRGAEALGHGAAGGPSHGGSGHVEPGSRKQCRRGHRAGAHKPSAETVPAKVTTLMIQNLPYVLSRDDLLGELDRCGYGDLFNFCHVPRTFTTGKNQGVAFVNFLSVEIAERFAKEWHGSRSLPGMSPFGKALRVKAATMQGTEACERIARSRRMRRVKTGTFKPLVISGQAHSSP